MAPLAGPPPIKVFALIGPKFLERLLLAAVDGPEVLRTAGDSEVFLLRPKRLIKEDIILNYYKKIGGFENLSYVSL